MENVFHWVAGVVVAGLLVVAAPNIAHQAMSDGPSSTDGRTSSVYAEADALRSYEHPEDRWCSGAQPGYESHYEAWEVSGTLPPTYAD